MINWGIIGFGNMGRKFAECFNYVDQKINLFGYASNSNLKSFNENKTKFDSYKELIESKNIDAVYISTLNNSHKDLVIYALQSQKKVLCEKPLGINFKEVNDIKEIIKDKKNLIFEAITYRSHPQTNYLKKIIKDKELGEIKKIESYFGFKVKRIKDDSRLFKKELGGGSILDVGCYPISFFTLFLKDENNVNLLNSKIEDYKTGVDIDAQIELKLNDTIDAKARVCFTENLSNICKIYCEKGTIFVPEPWIQNKLSFIEIETKSRYYKNIFKNDKDSYSIQLETVSNIFMGNKSLSNDLIGINESLKIKKILDLWLKK